MVILPTLHHHCGCLSPGKRQGECGHFDFPGFLSCFCLDPLSHMESGDTVFHSYLAGRFQKDELQTFALSCAEGFHSFYLVPASILHLHETTEVCPGIWSWEPLISRWHHPNISFSANPGVEKDILNRWLNNGLSWGLVNGSSIWLIWSCHRWLLNHIDDI